MLLGLSDDMFKTFMSEIEIQLIVNYWYTSMYKFSTAVHALMYLKHNMIRGFKSRDVDR